MARESNEQQLGRIIEALERGQEDRKEMREDLLHIRESFADMKSVFAEMRTTLVGFHTKHQGFEADLDGKEGLKNRMFMAEAQIKDHEEIISKVKALVWKIGLGALFAAAVAGAGSGSIVDRFLGTD